VVSPGYIVLHPSVLWPLCLDAVRSAVPTNAATPRPYAPRTESGWYVSRYASLIGRCNDLRPDVDNQRGLP